jgi:hypothetical protein
MTAAPSANVDVTTASAVSGHFDFPARFSFPIGPTDTYCINLYQDAGILSATRLFESVALISADVYVHLGPSSAGALCVCFAGPRSSIRDAVATQSYSPSGIGFASTDSSQFLVHLPVDHTFGRELRGLAIGNAPPALHVSATGYSSTATPQIGMATVHLLLRGSGHAADPVVLPMPLPVASAGGSTGGHRQRQ